ncbi:MAG: hypothetical protein IMW89_11590 [Ktedonobacteraceae bacterium]|nr:hypothetical protein [Ktedonobacteraceae bacterium]
MKIIKAIYNFIVGDMIILGGVGIILIVLGLINVLEPLRPIRPACGAILIGALLIVLVSTLYREAGGKQ